MRVGPYTFEPATYFHEVDHLRAGGGQIGESDDPRHIFFFADGGEEPVGVELFGPRQQLDADGAITITLPSGERTRITDAEALVRRAARDAA